MGMTRWGKIGDWFGKGRQGLHGDTGEVERRVCEGKGG